MAPAGQGLDVVLHDFQPIQPRPGRDQGDLLRLTAELLAAADPDRREEIEAAVERYGVSPSIISRRQWHTLPAGMVGPPPVTHADPSAAPAGLPLEGRMRLYRDLVDEVVDVAWADRGAPDELLHVTCSGYMAPSPVERYVSRRKWTETTVTHCYHMGCYGAFPAVRVASGALTAAAALRPGRDWTVDVLHSEFLSPHLDLTRTDPGDIVSATLFADGFIRYSAGRADAVRQAGHSGLRVLAYRETIIPDSPGEMTWDLEAHQFHMFLSRNVPLYVGDVIDDFVNELCAAAGLRFDDERSSMVYALHPGGAKIVDFLRDRLGLEEAQVATSREVLRRHGNMSSATVPHIWAELVQDPEVPVGTRVLSVAFGPGLTAAGLVMEKV